MKKALLIALTALVAVSFSFGQDAAPAPAPSLGEAATDHYSVMSEQGQERADSLSRQLEAYFELYNAVFRFDPAEMKAKLNVREFAEKAGFDSYLGQVVGQTKDDFVYLHYPSPERSELLVFAKDDPDFSASLAHQGFVQFVKAFIPNPPLWMREGLAVCFESAAWYDATGTVEFPENLAWLETVKALNERNLLMPLDRLLEIGQEEARSELDIFYPQAWAFASFLMNSGDKSYNRLLWDAINVLKSDATLEDNQAQVYRMVDTWYGIGLAERDFASYLDERKTFSELIAAGVRLYAEKAWAEATASFEAAAAMNAESYVPDYYLGLIAYAQNDFTTAEYRYSTALALGCDPAITNYALGVNAYAQNRLDDAKSYLSQAKDAAPDRYGAKVDDLVAKIGK